jgi:hypothetical protein
MAFQRPSRADVVGKIILKQQRAQRPHDFEADADEALQAACNMPPGRDRVEALKLAGRLRKAADVYGVIFAKRGRPSK